MAENTYKSNTFKKPEKEKKSKSGKSKSRFNLDFFKDPRFALAFGFFLLITSLYLFTAFLSYLFTGKADQSVVEALWSTNIVESGKEADNWLGCMELSLLIFSFSNGWVFLLSLFHRFYSF
jgi:S-DNA-T family DNA segregation ATPase FtsK/SpoIIIE